MKIMELSDSTLTDVIKLYLYVQGYKPYSQYLKKYYHLTELITDQMLNKKNTSELEDIVIYLTWSETENKRTKYINKASATCEIISSGLISGNCNPRTWSRGGRGRPKTCLKK